MDLNGIDNLLMEKKGLRWKIEKEINTAQLMSVKQW